jgi:uncharacterized protein (TIGR00297 family)
MTPGRLAMVGLAGATALLPLTVRAGWLTWGGAGAAFLIAAALWLGQGWIGVGLLVAFFTTSSILTKIGRLRTRSMDGRCDRDMEGRRGSQVFANGGVAALCGLFGVAGLGASTQYAAAAALAAATADGRRVEPGTSGGVSWAGSAAGVLGALWIAALAALAWGEPRSMAAVGLGGVGGMMVDSWVGAAWEERAAWIDNDLVNWLGTAAGAALGALIASV